ncbi:UDP-2-acetamido-3-amino-2,3-dideoxy-glucuronate N-acetyltransferase [Hymenobacter gelipurpurascens]|uniref:UDP-2-acetamido-3-amino-2,3-dideoxy-glucuronate N-acetyltransferase n=1 Tax=Hymenobacter gelipurpurascens TaxID=89968 RepID=A0A212UFZ1_9BACT|nr:acyltransferase [Hymenobacter gelipurpurascens]SNC77188.1 UDP-2-acetamido-3-amino-2,3-dideoxy-glucuronate N-acetyltransferase [Hymenobacter gelipurpurascens]
MPEPLAYFAHPTAILDEGCRIGNGCRIWHFSHVSAGAELGENCSLGQNVFVADGVRLGRNVKVQNNVSLYTGVECADDVFIGPSVVFTNVLNPRSAVSRRHEYQATIVAQGVSIGANSTIVCGTHLGEYAFIGAGSVVTTSVAPYVLAYGNPARPRGWMSEQGHPLTFNAAGLATCPESGQQYYLTNHQVSRINLES